MEYNNRILFVDDDPNVLKALERDLFDDFEIETAVGGLAALQVLAEEQFAVVVSDMQMPVMNGLLFLRRVQKLYPDTVRIMLTGNADLSTAINAVNVGNIYRYISKPCPTENLIQILEDSIKKHQQIVAEKELLESTFQATIHVLLEVLSITNPVAFSRTKRRKYFVAKLAELMDLPDRWQYEVAALLSQIGCVTIPPDILEKVYTHQDLTEEENGMLTTIPEIGYNLLSKIPRLEIVSKIVANQRNDFDLQRYSENEILEPEIIGSALLRIVNDYDVFLSTNLNKAEALHELQKNRLVYHPELFLKIKEIALPEIEKKVGMVNIDSLRIGMVLERDIKTLKGVLLAKKGQEVSSTMKMMLNNHLKHGNLEKNILVKLL